MPFAITLLVLLAAACALSSAIPQGATWEQYAVQYGERTAGWIVGLQLDDAFHSWWFIGLSAFLCLNLLCCNLTRLPSLLKRVRTFGNPEKMISANATAEAQGTGDPQQMFTALRMGKPAGSGVSAAGVFPAERTKQAGCDIGVRRVPGSIWVDK